MSSKPAYLLRTFLAEGRGFRLAADPPFDPLSAEVIRSTDSFVALTGVLERAKQGRFGDLSRAVEIMHADRGVEVWDACAFLLGYAAPKGILEIFLKRFERDLFVDRHRVIRAYACEILARSLQFWAVAVLKPFFLEAAVTADAEMIGMWTSDLIEEKPGPVFLGELPPAEWAKVVDTRSEEVRGLLHSDRTPVLFGRPFAVKTTAARLLAKLTADELDADDVSDDRMWFEANTGLDCSPFYDDAARLRPLAAAGIVEGFLESPEAAKYEDGVRYFFGHRIAD